MSSTTPTPAFQAFSNAMTSFRISGSQRGTTTQEAPAPKGYIDVPDGEGVVKQVPVTALHTDEAVARFLSSPHVAEMANTQASAVRRTDGLQLEAVPRRPYEPANAPTRYGCTLSAAQGRIGISSNPEPYGNTTISVEFDTTLKQAITHYLRLREILTTTMPEIMATSAQKAITPEVVKASLKKALKFRSIDETIPGTEDRIIDVESVGFGTDDHVVIQIGGLNGPVSFQLTPLSYGNYTLWIYTEDYPTMGKTQLLQGVFEYLMEIAVAP